MKTLRNLLLKILFAALCASCGSVMAAGVDLVGDDTDLFTTNPNIPAQVPNVLFIVDNTSSWARNNNGWSGALDSTCVSAGMPATGNPNMKQGDAELCAIFTETAKLSQGVNVGFMLFNDQNKGSYVRFPMQSMTSTNIGNLKTLLSTLNIQDPTKNVGTTSTYEDNLNDAFRYSNTLGTYPQNAASTHAAPSAYTDSSYNH